MKITERRTAADFAQVIKELVDDVYPAAEKTVLVMDNLNTHKPASLYEVFEPAEARRLLDKLEIHHTPKHGSWLNMAETDSSSSDCGRKSVEAGIINHCGLVKRSGASKNIFV